MKKVCLWRWGGVVALGVSQSVSQAALFEDDEARRAILDLRQKMEQLSGTGNAQNKLQTDEIFKLRSALLDLQAQIDVLKADQARLRGANEQLLRDLSEQQQRQKDVQMGLEDRLRKFEPLRVTLDGVDILVEPAEKRDFDAAMGVFRKGDFAAAETYLSGFTQRYPNSAYLPSALFWLGNAEYANKDYAGAVTHFKRMLVLVPKHQRAAEAMLAISNCQIELKDTKVARKTLEDLVKTYPDSEAAQTAKERLARLK
jgi:tol-pal system protein YbgF